MWLKATAGQTPQTDRCRIPYRTPNRSGRQEPMVSRIYVEKKPGFDVEAQQLKGELTEILGIKGIEALRIINRYDVEGIDEELFRSCVPTVFSEPQVDVTYDELPASDGAVFAVEFLPGQFDQRADSASECVQLISQGERPAVRSAKVYMISGALDEAAIEAIKHYVVNPVEARIASLDLPETLYMETPEPQPVEVLDGFRELDEAGLAAFIADRGLAMDEADIAFCQQYFRDEDRDPTITEIRVIDTYWSDHCRHTTFGTVLDDVTIDDAVVQQAFDRYMEMRHELGRDAKPVCLMDMGTIGAKYLKKTGVMTDVDESEEINACTVKVKVDVDGEDQDWLFLFKNETHNHPTEIEPFGGAATCVGGAIRDPLSGRSYVYQAMRVTGAGDTHGLVHVAAARERVADGAAHAGGGTAEGLDLGRVVVGLVLKQEQPVLVLAVDIDLHLDGAGVDLLGLVDIGHDAGLLKVLGADGAHVHEADGLGVAAEFVAHLHVAVEGLLHHGVVDRHVVQDGAEGGMAAVIGPIGVDHADFGDGGVAILIAEVLLAEGDVCLVHGKAAIGDKGGKAGLIELAEAVEHLDGLGLGGLHVQSLGQVERGDARLDGVHHVVLDGLDGGFVQSARDHIDLGGAHGGALALADELHALAGGVGALVKLARQEFDGKDGAIACGELVVGHIDLGLAKDGRHAGAEKLLVDALDVVAVDDPQGLDALDAENFGQLALELLSLDVEPGFLLHVDTRDHWFLPS